HDRVLRVAAQSIQRLMGLAGESLVEAHRLPEFVRELKRLKDRLGGLAGELEKLERLACEWGSPALVDASRAAGVHPEQDRQLLVEEMGRIERYGWRVDELSRRLYREAQKSRMRPFRDGVVGLVRMVRDLARELGKEVRLEIAGESTEVDRDVLEGLEAPITHLLRNSLAHGLEQPAERTRAGKPMQGRILLEARHHAGTLWVGVTDDGRGVDLEAIRARALERQLASPEILRSLSPSELLEFVFLPGFTTAQTVTEIAGRGVGLDAVRSGVEAMGGSVRLSSELGRSTAFHLRLPVTRSVIRALLVEIAGERYAFPLLRIAEILRLPRSEVGSQEGRDLIVHRGESLALVSGARLLGFDPTPELGAELSVVVLEEPGARAGLLVDRFLGEQDLVVHPLDPRLGRIPGISAAAILGNGMPALIPDVEDLFRSLERLPRERSVDRAAPKTDAESSRRTRRVLVVDDSLTVREAERQLLENAGYRVDTGKDGIDGWNLLRSGSFDLVITDVDMPGMNGIDLVRRIRGEERFRSLPVIIVSYKDRNEDKLRGLDAGATSYLTKSSFHDRSFVECVEDLIGPGGA
ncbi:MAG: hybrid sensor histidine kinase/response regulator, partial [Myxococcales bacterium]